MQGGEGKYVPKRITKGSLNPHKKKNNDRGTMIENCEGKGLETSTELNNNTTREEGEGTTSRTNQSTFHP